MGTSWEHVLRALKVFEVGFLSTLVSKVVLADLGL
jgi:hypothetical protein